MKNMHSWSAIDLAVDIAACNVHFARRERRLEKHFGTAVTAEAALALFRTLVPGELVAAVCHFELRFPDSDPANDSRAMRAPTITAMAMTEKKCRRGESELECPTRATAVHDGETASCSPIGRVRIRFPVAAKIALVRAGAAVGMPISPAPEGACVVLMMVTSTCGARAIGSSR